MPTTIQARRGIAADWTSANPTLAAGEFGFETDTLRLKVGNGSTAWTSLVYVSTKNALANDKLLGSGNSGSGAQYSEITLGSNLSMSGTTLNVTAGGGSTPLPGMDPRSAIYQPFTVTGVDDEFDDGSLTGWTAVNSGTFVPTYTEANDSLSILHPGGSTPTAGNFYAQMKATTVNTNDIIEMCFRGFGRAQNFNTCGLVFADGATFGAGNQVAWYISPAESSVIRFSQTNYGTSSSGGTAFNVAGIMPFGDILMRFKYEGSNNWRGYLSVDGTSWIDVTGSFSRTLTPTHVGFMSSTWAGILPYNWSIRYFRKTT